MCGSHHARIARSSTFAFSLHDSPSNRRRAACCEAGVPVPASLAFVLTLTALGTIYLGIFPDAVQQFAASSVLSLTLP